MIMKGRRNQAKKRPGLEFYNFRLEKKTRAKSLLLLKNQLLIRISEMFLFKKTNRTRNSFLMKNELLARLSSHLKKALRSKRPKFEREAYF